MISDAYIRPLINNKKCSLGELQDDLTNVSGPLNLSMEAEPISMNFRFVLYRALMTCVFRCEKHGRISCYFGAIAESFSTSKGRQTEIVSGIFVCVRVTLHYFNTPGLGIPLITAIILVLTHQERRGIPNVVLDREVKWVTFILNSFSNRSQRSLGVIVYYLTVFLS